MTTHDEALRALEKLTGTFSIEEWRVADRTLRRYINEQREAEQTIVELAGVLRIYVNHVDPCINPYAQEAYKEARKILARLEQKEQPDAEAQ